NHEEGDSIRNIRRIMRGADHRKRRTRLQGDIEGERHRLGGGFQRGRGYGANQSRHLGIAADSVRTGADLFRDRRSGGAEPILLHGHGGAGSLDANERQRGKCDDSRGGGAGGQLWSAGVVCRYHESGSLVLQRDQYVEEAYGGYERLFGRGGHEHLDWIQQLLGRPVAATGNDSGESAVRRRQRGKGIYGYGRGHGRKLFERRGLGTGIVQGQWVHL